MSRVVYSAGNWIEVPLPVGRDPCWTEGDCFRYSTMFALAQEKGHSRARAAVLAEALVAKRVYPGLVFGESIENDLEGLEK